jgi:type VI secretion system secreted protein Hcp
MSFDAFIQIDGIKGDSTDDKHKEWIEVLSYGHTITQPSGGAGSAQGTHSGGRADHSDFMITKYVDSASPLLAQYCCTAKPIPNVKFDLCRAMGDKTKFMSYHMKEVIVSSVNPAGSSGQNGDVTPTENVALRYGEIHWEYVPTDAKGGGKTGAAIKAAWSTLQNKAL